MVYGICYIPYDKDADLKLLGVNDSKILTHEKRCYLLDQIIKNNNYIGWAIYSCSASEISQNMQARYLLLFIKYY